MLCIDANVILEVIEKRTRSGVCQNFLEAAATGNKATTMLTLDLVMYFAEKDRLDLRLVKEYLDGFIWLPLMPQDAEWAFAHFDGKDFEDGLQVACALREDCNGFVTLDQALAKKYAKQITVRLLRPHPKPT